MKKLLTFTAAVLTLLLVIAVPALAGGSGGLVAVKTEDGVYLSWNKTSAESYTLYRDGEAIAVTAGTNYVDAGADGTALYRIDDMEPVSVWADQYLEIPVEAPSQNLGDITVGVRAVELKTAADMSIGNNWHLVPLEDGGVVPVREDGTVMDVNAQSTAVGGSVGTYAFNNGDNQKFYLEESGGGYVIKGKQSGLYLGVAAGGEVTIRERADASVFTVSDIDLALTEAEMTTVKAIKGEVVYTANDASVGDLDGDGEYEIVLKWDPSDSKDASQNGRTGNVYIDAYELDGTRLWRIDLGRNIRAGAHDTQFLVYDLDGDGKAEVAFRTADGTVDGQGAVIGDPNAFWTDNWSGKNLEGPLWVTVFEGATGKALASVPYDPQSDEPSVEIFGDNYGNRSERYNACVAYLDGENPYMVFQRGYYGGREGSGPGRTVVAAFSYKNGAIEKYWRFDTMDEGNEKYVGQGNHNVSVADVDGDGKDEILFGALTLDNDGSVLWCSFMGHGDAMHLGDYDPYRPGLEFFTVHEHASEGQQYGFTVFDAATGEILQKREAGKDTGRGVMANIGPFGGTYTAWAGSGAGKINSLGENLDYDFNTMNFRIFWDGDLYEELLDGTSVFKINSEGRQELIFNAAGCASNNGSKSNPCLQADILGDWREEVLLRSSDGLSLRLYTTTIPTEFSLPPLMEDHVYRMGVVWQNSSYNQPPHLGYYPAGVVELTVGSDNAKVNGLERRLDAAPYIDGGRTLVPLRFIGEALGAKVDYDNGVITVTAGEDVVVMNVGSADFTVNGEARVMETVPVLKNDRTLVPVRMISEALGMEVGWDGEARKVTIRRRDLPVTVTPINVENTAASAAVDLSQPRRIFVAGDSTAQSYRDSAAPQAGWGQMLGLFFDGSVTVENRAIAGRSLKSFYDDGRWNSILNDAAPGDYVIIQFGHNDGAWNKPERYISLEDYPAFLDEKYIGPALDKGLIPIIATQTQSHWFGEDGVIGEPDPSAVSYTSLLRDAAERWNLTLIDVNKLSRELENSMGAAESERLHLYAGPGEYPSYPDGVADNTHFSYYGAFEIAKIIAGGLEQIDDLRLRRADGYAMTARFEGEHSFDVRQYLAFAGEFSVAVSTDVSDLSLTVNGRPVYSKTAEFTTRTAAEDGRINVSASGPVTVEVAPVWVFAPEGGIDAAEDYPLDIPDGTYDFYFTKADNERGNIYINSLLVGANVDMYGTVGVPEGTVYAYRGFDVQGGAAVRVDQRTTRLAKVEAVKTPSIFARKTRIFVGGDSTLCNYYPVIPDVVEADIPAGERRTGWAQLLDRYVSPAYEVVNLASSGDWARDWKDCIFPTVMAQGRPGDILIIQFGINDRNRDDKSKDTMKDALRYMINECIRRGITPILVKPQPSVGYTWGTAGENEAPNGNNGGFFDAVTEVADETGCPYIDLYALAGEHFAQVGRDYVSRSYQLWDSSKNEMADKLHISFAGAREICSLFVGEASERGYIAAEGYFEVTRIVDGVYLFVNGKEAFVFNNTDEVKDVALTYELGVEYVTVAPHNGVIVDAPLSIAA